MITMVFRAAVSAVLMITFINHAGVQAADYNVDCSFPIHSKQFKCGELLGDRETFYNEYMEGCRKRYGKKGYMCDQYENDRIAMSVRQPQSMVNYTSTGFKKIRAPEKVMKLLYEHWEQHKDSKKKENWGKGNIYVNDWESPTYMVSVEDPDFVGPDTFRLKNMVWDAAKETIEEWTGMEQRPSSMYGIRIYTEGAVLSPHVDRLPLVSSCIVNVAQDVDEPWPLEVYDRNNNAVNVTMEPGDMVLYESGSLIHGRPFPLKGRYYANIFIHFEPTGRLKDDESDDYLNLLDDFLPPYIQPGSPEVRAWTRSNPHGWKKQAPSAAHVDIDPGHFAAREGDVGKLAQLYFDNKNALTKEDRNGWQPIHEAARSGRREAIELLINFGADVNARTHDGKGGTPLNVALSYLKGGQDHPVAQYLKKHGAVDIEPEL